MRDPKSSLFWSLYSEPSRIGGIGGPTRESKASQDKDQKYRAHQKTRPFLPQQEAADLVRYQQAYQASAKVMQTASVLFDAIIAIR